MSIVLGSAFTPAPPQPESPPTPTVIVERDEDLARAVMVQQAMLRELAEAVQRIASAPPVQVDLTEGALAEVVTAVNGLKPAATPDEIAEAIARVLGVPERTDAGTDAAVLSRLADALENLDFRLKGVGTQAYGGGTVQLATQHATVLEDLKRGITDYESRLDYDVRTDEQPVYIGRATAGTATSATTWVIEKVTYDGDDRPSRKQVLTGSWDDRASLGWV